MTSYPWRVACFDLDGTLVPGTTVSQHLADAFGHGKVLAELEQRYRAAEISNVEVAQRQAAHFIGRRVDELTEAIASIPRIDGIDDTLEWLRARDVEPILCTVTWRFAADCFRRWYGFTAVSGTEAEVDSAGRLTGRIMRHFDKHDKPAFVTAYCAERAIPLSRCFAVGDSHGDVPSSTPSASRSP